MSEIHFTKKCKQCGEEKELSAFSEQTAGKYGRTSRCRECVNTNHRAYRDRIDPPHLRPVRVARELLAQGLKRCAKCGEIKPLAEFRKVRRPDGYLPGCYCKPCDLARCADWEGKNQEYRRAYHRQHGKRPEVGARKRAYRRKLYAESPKWVMQIVLRHALRRCPTNNPIAFAELWAMWEKSGGRCAVSGLQMTWGKGRVMPNSFSLDRIDPTGGYSKGNVRLVCHAINAFRGRMTDADMLDMARAIVANLDKPESAPGLLSLVA